MSNITNQDIYWNQPGADQNTHNPYYDGETDYTNLQTSQLDFQSFGDESKYYNTSKSYIEPFPSQYPEMFTPMDQGFKDQAHSTDFDEPPLLEELEIYPDRIMEKTLLVLNPFRSLSVEADFLTKENDLAGPIAYCLLLACSLYISGNKSPFGFIYGFSVVSCILMFFLLTLMTPESGVFSLSGVASILGYSLLPIVGLSVIAIFLNLGSRLGIALALLAVFWSSISASKLFSSISGHFDQRPLIAYPCALVSGVFAMLVIF